MGNTTTKRYICATLLMAFSLLAATASGALAQKRRVLSLALTERDGFLIVSDAELEKSWRFIASFSDNGRVALQVTVHIPDHTVQLRPLSEKILSAGVSPKNLKLVVAFMGAGRSVTIIAERIAPFSASSGPRQQPDHHPCPPQDIRASSFFDANNDPDPSFGCVDRENLRAMVDDPADLKRGKPLASSDGERSAIPIVKYRTFQVPHLSPPNSSPTLTTPSGRSQ